MNNWAKKEIELACKKENPNWDGKSFDYGCMCYQSALKAFNSLLEDEHSGMSIHYTMNILNRLVDGKCLTPIEDNDDIWDERERDSKETQYQCKRMSSLFKYVSQDGTVTYMDVDRTVLIDQNNMPWHNGNVTRLVDEKFPITMPYYPPTEKFRVYAEEFLVDPKNGDYDTYSYLYIITPDEEKIDLNLYFTERDGQDVQITKEEYEELKKKAIIK